MTRFTICDDEPEHGELISRYIKTEYAKHMPETDIAEVVVYQSPQEMLDEAIEDTDIFILDIECGKSSGLDIAKEIRRLNKNAGIVFCTSHSNYVYQVFGLTPIDFIRKNNIEKDIVQTMYNIMDFLREKKKILVIEKGNIIRLSDIVSVNVIKHDLIFKGVNGERKIRANLSTYEEQLKQFGFIKISQGEMVNKDYIKERKRDNLIMKDGTVYHISRSRVDEIRRMFESFINLFQSVVVTVFLIISLGCKDKYNKKCVSAAGILITFIYLTVSNHIVFFESVGIYVYMAYSLIFSFVIMSGSVLRRYYTMS